jgi:anaerobic selenocysteine-containing dehydrogenase
MRAADRGVVAPMALAWVGTACNGCYNACGIRVGVRDGVIVDIAGDPANPAGRGHICAKGKARAIEVYSPRRLLHPMRRTNAAKGRGVDPGWRRISWEEAVEEIAARLAQARAEDPNSVVVAHFDMPVGPLMRAWSRAFGTQHDNWSAAGLFCGMGSHPVNMLVNGAFNSEIDFDHCEHAVLFGTQMGL